MQAAQSPNSIVLPAGGVPPVLRWRFFQCESFTAEFTVRDGDIIYHFFPPKGQRHFDDRLAFAKKLDGVFKQVFPSNADVRAEYIEGQVTLRHKQSQLVEDAKLDRMGRVARPARFEEVDVDSTIGIQPHTAKDEHPQDAWHITAKGAGSLPGALRFFGDALMARARESFMLVGG